MEYDVYVCYDYVLEAQSTRDTTQTQAKRESRPPSCHPPNHYRTSSEPTTTTTTLAGVNVLHEMQTFSRACKNAARSRIENTSIEFN